MAPSLSGTLSRQRWELRQSEEKLSAKKWPARPMKQSWDEQFGLGSDTWRKETNPVERIMEEIKRIVHLWDKPVEVGVSRTLDIEGATTYVVDGLVVQEDSYISMLQKWMSGQDAVVRLHDRGGDLGRRIDSETELRFLSVVHREPLQQQASQTGTSSSADGIEDEEALETGAVIC